MSRVIERPGRGGPRRVVVVLAVVGLLVAGAGAVDVLAGTAPRPAPEPVPGEVPRAGTWYCPVTAGDGEAASVAVAAAGEESSRVTVSSYRDGARETQEPIEIAASESTVVDLDGRDARSPVVVDWAGGPVAATWRVQGDRTSAAPCAPEPSATWYATGFDTTLGSTSTLHLFNPFTVDAVVRLVFATPTGPVRLVLTDSLVVPASGSSQVSLNRFQPEIPDLGVKVEVLSGRVVAQGEVDIDPPGDEPGTAGRALLPASTALAETWHSAYARSAEGAESWLSIFNPGQRDAAVEVAVTDPLNRASDVLGEVSVPAGAATRVELADASGAPEFGVSARVVNGEPVIVTRLTAVRGDRAAGVAASLGAPATATTWVLPGGGSRGEVTTVNLYNPGPEPTTVAVEAGEGTPRDWSGIRLGPNTRTALDVDALDVDARARAPVPVRVTATEGVVVELRSAAPDAALALWTTMGAPASTWLGPAQRLPVRIDPGLSARPSTALDAEPPDGPTVETDVPVVPAPSEQPTVAPEPPAEGSRRSRDGESRDS